METAAASASGFRGVPEVGVPAAVGCGQRRDAVLATVAGDVKAQVRQREVPVVDRRLQTLLAPVGLRLPSVDDDGGALDAVDVALLGQVLRLVTSLPRVDRRVDLAVETAERLVLRPDPDAGVEAVVVEVDTRRAGRTGPERSWGSSR